MKEKKLEDDSWMPYGKYSKGTDRCKMEDVPAWYLLWLWDEASAFVRSKFSNVFDYIKENRQGLEQEKAKGRS